MRISGASSTAIQILRDEHSAMAAMLRSMGMLLDRGPQLEPVRFFEAVRAMLFYIDEFPERLHHPKESKYLFPRLAAAAPHLQPVLDRLEADHLSGERRVRELQHLLTAWELIGEARREAFLAAAQEYVRFHLEHIQLEETEVLPLAAKALSADDLEELDAVFCGLPEPMATGVIGDPAYDRLFSHIVLNTPAPIGVGAA